MERHPIKILVILFSFILSIILPLSQGYTEQGPINVMVIIHIEPLRPQDALNDYLAAYRDLIWLYNVAHNYGVKLTILSNGEFMEYALERNEIEYLRLMIIDGHELGTHAHSNIQRGLHDWPGVPTFRFGLPIYNRFLTKRVWKDNRAALDNVLSALGYNPAIYNITMCAVPFKCSDEGVHMAMNNFKVALGNRSEMGNQYIGHIVYHPWRPNNSDEAGHELEENLKTPFVEIDHLQQIGKPKAHGIDCTIEAMKSYFVAEYQEWYNDVQNGDSVIPRVWSFGFCYHPGYGFFYRNDLIEMLEWLNSNYIGAMINGDQLIARYATASQIYNEFKMWEREHPGESSFNYVHEE